MPAGPYCPQEDLHTTAYISGAAAGSADSAYALPANLSTDTCTVHNAGEDAEPIDITGDTGRVDEAVIPDDDDTDQETPDSPQEQDDEEQVLIDPEDISD
jgi:hypothetical protein